MDKNQIGPNINTTAVQKSVKDSPYPSGQSSASTNEAANSDLVPFVGDPRECRGYVAFPPSFGRPRRQG